MTPMTSTMLTIPMTMMGRVVIHEVRCSISVPPLAQQGQQQSAGDDRGYLARDVDTDGVHQQEILVVLLEAQLVDDTAAHGEGRDAGCADHGVELFALREEEVRQLCEQHTAGGVKHKGHEAQRKDEQSVGPHELVGGHLPGHGQAQHDRDEVGQHILGRLGQGVQHAALAQQVAEHEEADQRHTGGRDKPGQHSDHNREQNFGGFADATLLVRHPDPPLLLGGAKADDRRLHDGNQRHIAVGRHHDSAQILAAQRVGDKDGRGAVCRADNGDGGCVRQVEEQPGQHQRDKDAQLRRRAEQHQPRLFQQRAEVDHGTDADEEQQREQLVGHAGVKKRADRANGLALCDGAGHRQVDKDRTEAHRQQQARLHFFGDGKVDQQAADDPHDHHLPGEVAEVCEQPGKGLQDLHKLPPMGYGRQGKIKRPLPQKKLRQKSQNCSMPRSRIGRLVVTKRYGAATRVPYSLLPT